MNPKIYFVFLVNMLTNKLLTTISTRTSVIPNGMFPTYNLLAWRVIWLAAGWGGGGTGRGAVASPRAGGGMPTVGTWPAAEYQIKKEWTNTWWLTKAQQYSIATWLCSGVHLGGGAGWGESTPPLDLILPFQTCSTKHNRFAPLFKCSWWFHPPLVWISKWRPVLLHRNRTQGRMLLKKIKITSTFHSAYGRTQTLHGFELQWWNVFESPWSNVPPPTGSIKRETRIDNEPIWITFYSLPPSAYMLPFLWWRLHFLFPCTRTRSGYKKNETHT